ncbi:hypothetical protein D3OALGB2SA_5726 [Olavius algarvensis associated proteobacterium Delta 3]|nr:hypothetical protein D3OALGB2SA_5726 [Olavius algarvensis associated proteobacterium Delta 3]
MSHSKSDIAAKGHILVVDDNVEVRLLIEKMLARNGFDVQTASDVPSASRLVRSHPFDTVITDFVMPDVDGLDLLKIIRDRYPNLPVILMTGYATAEAATQALRLDAYDFLTKPIVYQELMSTVQRAVRAKRLSDEKSRIEQENQAYREKLERLVEERTSRLRESEQKYRRLFDNVYDIFFQADPEGNVILVSPSVEQILGYTQEEITGHNLKEFSADSTTVTDTLRERIRTEGFVDKIETPMRAKSGETVWLSTSARISRDDTDTVIGFEGIARDISDRKRIARELERRNAILEGVRLAAETFLRSGDWQEHIQPVLAQLGDSTGACRVYICENKAAGNRPTSSRKIHEWTATGTSPLTLGSKLEDLGYTSGFSRWAELLSAGEMIHCPVKELPEFEREALIEQNILSIAVVPIFVDEQWWGFIGFDDCRTEHRWSPHEIEALRAAAGILGAAVQQERSREKLSLLATALEQAAYGIVITDTNRLVQYVNPTFEHMTGIDRDHIIGTPYEFFPGETTPELSNEHIFTRLAQGKPWHTSYTARRSDGSTYEEEITASAVKSANGEAYYYVIARTDITERRRLEAIAEADNLMQNIGYTFSGIRHEIGNPINSVKVAISMLENKLDQFDQNTIQEFLHRCLEEITRVEYLLTALKNFSLHERPEGQRVRLDEFLNGFHSLTSGDFESRGISVAFEDRVGECYGTTDPRALHQVMLNVMTNAADAVEKSDQPSIFIRLERSPGWLQIHVTDNGIGISDKQQEHLFKPFYTTKEKGTGLGLVIARKMLSSMNSTIDVDSRANIGTTVTISIPEGTDERDPD